MGEDVCVDGQFLLPLPCTRGAKGRPLLGISGLTDMTALVQSKKVTKIIILLTMMQICYFLMQKHSIQTMRNVISYL